MGLFILTIGVLAGVILTQNTQDIRKEATPGDPPPGCNINPPTNIKVTNITATTATLNWTPGTGGNYVKLWVSSNSNPTIDCLRLPNKVTDSICVANENGRLINGDANHADIPAVPSTYQVTGMASNTTYYWRIMMWKESGCDYAAPTISFTTTFPTPTPPRPDYCKSASANRATMNPQETLTLSSESNTPVNGFYYVTYNLDNLYGPGNAKPVCTGTGTNAQCPNGGTPLIFSDPNNSSTPGQKLRTNGSVYVPYADLFVNDKNWNNRQLKNVQFNAYFSLNGGQWSWPQPNCVTYTKMANTPTPPSQTVSCTSLSRDIMSPVVGQSVTATCQGRFSSSVTSPVAIFAVNINNGAHVFRSEAIPLSPAGASYTANVPIAGNYLIQCQICTDSTAANCTAWGGTACQNSFTVGGPTPTPAPALVCQQMNEYVGSIDVTSNLSSIKFGDTVIFNAKANSNGQSVRSMIFRLFIDNVLKEQVTAPAVLTNGVWNATYIHSFNTYGTHRIMVYAVTPGNQ